MKYNLLNKIKNVQESLVLNPGVNLNNVFVSIDKTLDNDVFQVHVGPRFIFVRAENEKMLFYGLLDFLQMTSTREILVSRTMRIDNKERGVHIDMGRKFYSKEWFMNLIDRMVLNKLDTLQMHVSENTGFRIESKRFPHLSSKECLTIEEVKEIIKYANDHYIDVIPSFDTPGHLGYILKDYPEFQLNGLPTGLNITKQEPINFIKELIDEIVEIFYSSSKFHMGADEYIQFKDFDKHIELKDYAKKNISKEASAADAYISYVNEIASYLMAKDKKVRVWNDAFYRKDVHYTVDLNPSIDIAYWTAWDDNMASVQEFTEKGHHVINFNDNELYYVLGENAGYKYPNAEKLKENFEYNEFPKLTFNNEKVAQNLSLEDKKLLGAFLSVWSDKENAKTETEVLQDLTELLPMFARKFRRNID